jgi:hypothetical protein
MNEAKWRGGVSNWEAMRSAMAFDFTGDFRYPARLPAMRTAPASHEHFQ